MLAHDRANAERGFASCEICDAPIVRKPVGRPRLTCSDRCRRRADQRRRKVRRREGWIEELERHALDGRLDLAATRREVADLRRDIARIVAAKGHD
jgi:hypothetical protein